ncbi:hypothetical protein QUA40_24625 [Microcoleus sp. Pol11C3]|uniref:hypothetical protein n=1 Tax=Microcoleus sp. Pol11C3 TaxID=3055390 RepID=UPI002FD0514B
MLLNARNVKEKFRNIRIRVMVTRLVYNKIKVVKISPLENIAPDDRIGIQNQKI